MLRPIHLAMMLLAVALTTSCNGNDSVPKTDSRASVAQPDPVTDTITKAMCAKPEDRAHAIARVARDPAINKDPDEVYDVAATIAEKGCPRPRG